MGDVTGVMVQPPQTDGARRVDSEPTPRQGRRARRRRLRPVVAFLAAVAVFGLMMLADSAVWLSVVGALLAPLAVEGVRGVDRAAARAVPSRAGGRIAVLVAVVLTSVMAWVCANLLLSPRLLDSTYGPASTSGYSPAAVAMLVPLLLLASIGLAGWDEHRGPPRWVVRSAVVVGLAVAVAAQLIIASGTARWPTSDPLVVLGTAYDHVVPGGGIIPSAWGDDYFARYSNNLPVTAVLVAAMSVAKLLGASTAMDYIWSALVLNCVALMATAVLTIVVVRRLLGRGAGLFAALPVTAFIVLSPWINLPYTDSLAIPFPIGLLALALVIDAQRRGFARAALWALFGVVGTTGCFIKPTVLFAFLAIGVVLVVRETRTSHLPRFRFATLRMPALMIATALVTTASVVLVIDALGLVGFTFSANRETLPFTHFMDMGMVGAGGYNEADVIRTSSLPVGQRAMTDLHVYFDRVAALGAWGYLLFLGRKALFILGDGSFYQGLDGVAPISAFHTGPVDQAVQQWYLLGGAGHGDLGTLWQAVWVLVLLLLTIPATRGALRSDIRVAVQLSVLALIAFLLLGEARSRYVYLYVPFFILLAANNVRGARLLLASAVTRLRDSRFGASTLR